MTSGSCRRIARRPAAKVTLRLGSNFYLRHTRQAILDQAVGDVELAKHFDPRHHTMQRRHRHLHVVLQHAVDTKPNDATVRRGFHVDITGPLPHRLRQDHVGQLNNRLRLGLGIGDRFGFGTLLDADAARHIDAHASKKALDVAFRGVVQARPPRGCTHGRRLARYRRWACANRPPANPRHPAAIAARSGRASGSGWTEAMEAA